MVTKEKKVRPSRATKDYRDYMKRWYQAHPGWKEEHYGQWCQKNPKYYQQRIDTMVNGTPVYLAFPDKPPKPDVCPLCGRGHSLAYHHWSDENLLYGLWLCTLCHQAAEVADKDLLEKYLGLKAFVELEYQDFLNGEEVLDYMVGGRICTNVEGRCVMIPLPFKRVRTPVCELCSRSFEHLNYHHWDSDRPSKGLYLCLYCHTFAEFVDRGLVDKYLKLKEDIEVINTRR